MKHLRTLACWHTCRSPRVHTSTSSCTIWSCVCPSFRVQLFLPSFNLRFFFSVAPALPLNHECGWHSRHHSDPIQISTIKCFYRTVFNSEPHVIIFLPLLNLCLSRAQVIYFRSIKRPWFHVFTIAQASEQCCGRCPS